MKILICGEGKHDIGVADDWCVSTGKYVPVDGWMQPVIRLIRGHEVAISIRKRRDLTLLKKDRSGLKPLPKGHGIKALMAKRAAVLGSFDVIVFMVDADSPDPKRWQAITNEIEDGFSRVEGTTIGVACVPMSASESWLLADAAAWSKVTANVSVVLPRSPETIWGKRDDPSQDHPHQIFCRVCQNVGENDDHRIRIALAEVLNLETVAATCPVSFAPFVERLKAA